MMCPLLAIAYAANHQNSECPCTCQEKECAWWISKSYASDDITDGEKKGTCAINEIARRT